MDWKKIVAIAGGGTVSTFILISLLVNLTGVSSTYTGDIICGETCESYINITTTYWNICFEHKGEGDLIIKKTATSRTLWVNLDKVTFTEPKVRTELQVPAVGKDNWRDIKDGDCISRGKINKFKLIGHKEPSQTIKWSFIIKDNMLEDVDIDPVWGGIPVSKIEGNCKNISIPHYEDVEHSYTCTDSKFNYTLNPKYAWCWHLNPGNSSYGLVFQHDFLTGNISAKTVWWNEWEYTGDELVEQCETICYKIGSKIFCFKDYAECIVNMEDKCIVCDSKIDGNGDGICQSGESCLDVCIDDLQEIKQIIRQDGNFISRWFDLYD